MAFIALTIIKNKNMKDDVWITLETMELGKSLNN